MAFIVDITKFQAEGALLNWPVVSRRLGMLDATTGGIQLPSVLQLRWTLNNELGLPTEPFIVWRRNKKLRGPKTIAAEVTPIGLLGNSQLVDFKASYSTVELNVSGSGGVVYAFVGSPWLNSIVAIASISVGNNIVVTLAAPSIEGLIVSSGVVVNNIAGVRSDDLTVADGWQKVEFVGLPVKEDDWAGQGIGRHGVDQGIFGAFTDAISAAKQRLERGAPPIGWAPAIESGVAAPPWSAPVPNQLLKDLNAMLLDDLRTVAPLPPATQSAKKISKPMPPPENSSGDKMSGPGGTSQVSPLSSTYMAAAIDCFNCLALGFGTAYPLRFSTTGQVENPLDFDYMITAQYEKGLRGNGPAVAYAALVPSPGQAIAPPIPANMAQQMMGNLRPLTRDGSWLASVRISWDRPVPISLFRPRSFAFVRSEVTPPSPAVLLMNKRSDGSPLPVAVNYLVTPQDPEPNRLSAVEREIPIPNNPGTRTIKYAAAHQDIYGQWSSWVAINASVNQPDVDEPRIVSAEFKYTSVPSPPAGICHANLVLEFLWDWRIRTPLTINFRGRLHAAAYHGAPPPNITLPSGLQVKLEVEPINTFTLKFDLLAANGAPTSSWPGYDPLTHCVALTQAGDQQVPFGHAQGSETRRYRVTIPGFELSFGPSGHIGLALWAQGQESIAPQHNGNWSKEPSVISTSDPRPPLIAPDIVTLSSLPDAAGESHAVLKWSGSPGADGYFIYETTESKLLKAVGESEPDPSKTLSQRLTKLRAIFDAHPAERRTEFTRRNSRLIKTTSSDITLPRGSTAIHLFAVLGVSAGQVEASWPIASTALYAFAVPRVPKPGAPTIEVSSFSDMNVTPNVYRSKIRIETRKGPRVRRIDLHRVRVDDAARDLDTMGPPVLTLDAMTPGWQVDRINDALGEHITVAKGKETPPGSWKRVWYRAVAWSADDPLRGTLATRSPASTVAWVVIPPSTPPDLSGITMEWPGTAPQDVMLKWTSMTPTKKTPLGPHTLAVRIKRIGAPLEEASLLTFDGPLSDVATIQAPGGSAVWRIEATKPTQYRAIIRRADINDAIQISLRLTDPVGRSTESLATINPGHILPDPVLADVLLKKSLNPPGVMLSWSSDTPLEPPVYSVRVTVNQPPRLIGSFRIPQPPIIQQMSLATVPMDEPGPVPLGADPLRIRRMPGAGPKYTYYAFVRVSFTQIILRLSSPDGRFAEHIQLPS
ncbi:MAG TPA: hypothetical protein PKI21_04600 [Nitrospira sp.]|nr:hypothetical protein [Nitrospira sp.]